MNKRRFLSLALALVLCLSLFPAARAAEAENKLYVVYDGEIRTYLEYQWPLIPVTDWNGNYGFANAAGSLVVSLNYTAVKGSFADGPMAVAVGDYSNRKWGFIDESGKEIVPCVYEEVKYFYEGLTAVKLDGKWGFVNTIGEEVIPCQYDDAYSFSEGLAAVKKDGKWGYIDKTGKEVVPFIYDGFNAYPFSEGLARVHTATGYGYVDATGAEVIPPRYSGTGYYAYNGNFSEGLAAVYLESDYTFQLIDKTGATVASGFSGLNGFSEGLCAAEIKTGNVDDEGIPEYKAGYVDATGEMVIPAKYDEAENFENGYALVANRDDEGNEVFGVIDKTGKEILPLQFEHINNGLDGLCQDGLFVVYVADGSGEYVDKGVLAGAYGLWDATGKELLPAEYDSLNIVDRNLIEAEKDGEYFCIDSTGKRVSFSLTTPTGAVIAREADLDKHGVYNSYYLTAAPTAYQSTQSVLVDGQAVEFQCYALKDANGNLTNYIKLRDLADILNGSSAQFQVGWDGSVTITTKTAYTSNGSEGSTPFSGDRAYSEATSATKINGQAAELEAFVLNDDAGGGYTYYQLRDLGQTLGFNVGWSADTGIFVETDKPYDPAN